MKTAESVPIATYRFQFNVNFTFKQANDLVDYLHNLGISHAYASPLLKAKPGSVHGYDIIDHSMLNPEIGTEEEFEALVQSLRNNEMGLVLDIVPNHMFIIDTANKWWQDILENGPASPYAEYFDIDWHTPRPKLDNKVLLPLLDKQYGEALESQALKVVYQNGAFFIVFSSIVLPTDPKSWNLILEPLVKETLKVFQENDPASLELHSVATAISHLPATTETDKEKIAERLREKEIIKQRLGKLLENNQSLSNLLSHLLEILNGDLNNSRSFDWLESFVDAQCYRLSYWRVASDEINYRRFFDILDLAGIRAENPEVFKATHSFIFDLVKRKLVDGIRIDHIDGLWDPEQYLQDLNAHCLEARGAKTDQTADKSSQAEPIYVIAEKILTGNEKLRSEWLLHGTVGYDFLNQLNGLYVYQPFKKALQEIYFNFTDLKFNTLELIYACKKLILQVSMSSELFVLARRLDSISEQHRSSRDFTAESLRSALRDVVASFPVYRSYIRGGIEKIHEEDRQYILTAIQRAKRLNPAISGSIFDFIQSVLTLEHPTGLEKGQITERENFVKRFQQLTPPVMAKGMEDTAFYRYYPLSSLKEVGSDPYCYGTNVDSFHKKNLERSDLWPLSMVATSTHDTKRGEDVRARINMLSEIPAEWGQALVSWSRMNQQHKVQDNDEFIPDANEEYLLYQTLIGTWPLYPMDAAAYAQYVGRLQGYMEKALKEAKIHTSWINPNKEYDQAVQQFIKKILDPESSGPFLKDFQAFVPRVVSLGMLNSLSQLLIKLTSPGIPDIYQGNEIWDFSLVDPDNRNPVDYSKRKEMLADLGAKAKKGPSNILEECLKSPQDGKIKMLITLQTLMLRQKLPDLFAKGSYIPINVQGDKQNHAIAYGRKLDDKGIVVISGRFFSFLMTDFQTPVEPNLWKGTHIVLPVEMAKFGFRNVFTGAKAASEKANGESIIHLDQVMKPLPFVLLESL